MSFAASVIVLLSNQQEGTFMKNINIYYSPDYLCEGYGVDTREKAADIVASFFDRPIEGIQVVAPEAATSEEVARVHKARYINALLTGRPDSLADANGIGDWSTDLRRSVFSMVGGCIASARYSYLNKVNSGSLSSGLHHARAGHGSGFCTLNGLAIAARDVLIQGAQRVLIIDLDAHGGGGTASLIDGVEGVEQIDVSVNHFDNYENTESARITRSSGESYLADIEMMLQSVVHPGSIDLVIYNAGMDPHEDCSTGGAAGITTSVLAQREEMVFAWAKEHETPVSFVLAGGYSGRKLTRSQLVDLHRLTIQEAAS
jgi:acetoin utilization deacetylase AcuC-like enzyme